MLTPDHKAWMPMSSFPTGAVSTSANRNTPSGSAMSAFPVKPSGPVTWVRFLSSFYDGPNLTSAFTTVPLSIAANASLIRSKG